MPTRNSAAHSFSHPNVPDVDQSDRFVPINLRQTGPTPVEMLISTRVRKSPFWHLSVEAGAWRATVYNRMYHPRGYVKDKDGGTMAEYRSLVHRVTLWNVAVERQIRVRGPDAEAFVNFVITRDATRIAPMRGKYCILCDQEGRILNDPVLLRLAEDEFWFSISDSDVLLWLKGVNIRGDWQVEIDEIDVAPLQVQGPLSEDLMVDIVGPELRDVPYYGMMEATIGGAPVVISQTGFSGEKGYEVYVRDASENAEAVWYAIRGQGRLTGCGSSRPATIAGSRRASCPGGRTWTTKPAPFRSILATRCQRRKRRITSASKSLNANVP